MKSKHYGSKGGKQKNSRAPSVTDMHSKPSSMKQGDDRTKSYGSKGVQSPKKSMGY